jgi:hypothetical protein
LAKKVGPQNIDLKERLQNICFCYLCQWELYEWVSSAQNSIARQKVE